MLTVLLFILTIFLLILPEMQDAPPGGQTGSHPRTGGLSLERPGWIRQAGTPGADHEGRRPGGWPSNHIRGLRYGHDLKDYFWINDMQPRMIMHPYRPDLEGKDISTFADPAGKRLFVACVKIVRTGGAGYRGLPVAMDG